MKASRARRREAASSEAPVASGYARSAVSLPRTAQRTSAAKRHSETGSNDVARIGYASTATLAQGNPRERALLLRPAAPKSAADMQEMTEQPMLAPEAPDGLAAAALQ